MYTQDDDQYVDVTNVTDEGSGMSFDRPMYLPPDIMTKSYNATVNRTGGHIPAPSTPAPPPPYNGKAIVNKPGTDMYMGIIESQRITESNFYEEPASKPSGPRECKLARFMLY